VRPGKARTRLGSRATWHACTLTAPGSQADLTGQWEPDLLEAHAGRTSPTRRARAGVRPLSPSSRESQSCRLRLRHEHSEAAGRGYGQEYPVVVFGVVTTTRSNRSEARNTVGLRDAGSAVCVWLAGSDAAQESLKLAKWIAVVRWAWDPVQPDRVCLEMADKGHAHATDGSIGEASAFRRPRRMSRRAN
jgi:hypothetical protein